MSEQHTNRVRASDAERERVAAALRHAMGEGRLSLAEGEERLAGVYATTYRDELAEFTADLPPEETAGAAGAPGAAGAARGPRGPRSSHGPRPVAGVAGILAVAAVIWAVAGSGPIWLAIVLGIVALSMAKHSGPGAHGWHGHRPPRCARSDAA